jgi:hypothetical protein
MSLPIPQKQWQIATVVNDLLGSSELNECSLEWKKKNQRVAFGHTILGSGNATAGALDGQDRWATYNDLFGDFVHGGSVVPRWMAIKQPGSGAADVVVHYGSGESDWIYVHSPSGAFTGGSVGVRPTATDETVLYNGSFHGRDDGGHAAPMVAHLWVSDDLTCYRQVHFFNNHNYGNLFYDAVDDPSVGWANPNYGCVDKEGVSKDQNCNCGALYQFCKGPYTGLGYFKSWGPHGAMNMLGTCEGSFNGGYAPMPWHTAKNKITNTYKNPPRCALFEPIGNADGGWHGRVFDWWWVGDTASPFTESFQFGVCADTPLDMSRRFIIVGDFMFPWNGAVPRTA